MKILSVRSAANACALPTNTINNVTNLPICAFLLLWRFLFCLDSRVHNRHPLGCRRYAALTRRRNGKGHSWPTGGQFLKEEVLPKRIEHRIEIEQRRGESVARSICSLKKLRDFMVSP